MFKYALLFVTFSFVMACGPNIEDFPWATQYKEVMDIHDEIMPQLGNLNKRMLSIEKFDVASRTDDAAEKKSIVLSKLNKADESMMRWMKELKSKSELAKMKTEDVSEYLSAEKVKVLMVSKYFDDATYTSDDFMKNVMKVQK